MIARVTRLAGCVVPKQGTGWIAPWPRLRVPVAREGAHRARLLTGLPCRAGQHDRYADAVKVTHQTVIVQKVRYHGTNIPPKP